MTVLPGLGSSRHPSSREALGVRAGTLSQAELLHRGSLDDALRNRVNAKLGSGGGGRKALLEVARLSNVCCHGESRKREGATCGGRASRHAPLCTFFSRLVALAQEEAS